MAQCMYPYYVEREVHHNQEDRYVPVPCGKCPECLKRRTASWAFRLEKEAERHDTQYFVTLTYNAAHIPLSKNRFMSLSKRDLQLYFKRLRKKCKFKYYAVGEYGTQRKRPHYHFIIFGDESLTPDFIVGAWLDPYSGKMKGNVHFGDVKSGSIRYTVQYYDKGDWKPIHSRDDRESEFSIMSKALGSNFLTESMVDYLVKNPTVNHLYEAGGKKIAIPRYYKNRIFNYQGTEKLVTEHPSFLVHRDERAVQFKERAKIAKSIMDAIIKVPDTRELNEGRKAAILNYRSQKRKTRD